MFPCDGRVRARLTNSPIEMGKNGQTNKFVSIRGKSYGCLFFGVIAIIGYINGRFAITIRNHSILVAHVPCSVTIPKFHCFCFFDFGIGLFSAQQRRQEAD